MVLTVHASWENISCIVFGLLFLRRNGCGYLFLHLFGLFFSSPGVPKGKGLFGITLCVVYGLSVSFPEKEIVVDTDLEIRIKLSAS